MSKVIPLVVTLLGRRKKAAPAVTEDSALFTEGLNLDSLEVAELSSMLDAEFGRDPFSDGELPETVGEIIRYYER